MGTMLKSIGTPTARKNGLPPIDQDVAAGVHESSLNSFLATHHEIHYSVGGPSLYKGGDKVDQLKLKWSYDVAKPASIDISPLSAAEQKLVSDSLRRQPEFLRFGNDLRAALKASLEAEPNVKLQLPTVNLRVEFDDPAGPPPIVVGMSLTVLGLLTQRPDGQLEFLGLNAFVDEPKMIAAINEGLKNLNISSSEVVIRADGACYPIDKLLRYVAGQLLAARIRQFSQTIPFPSVITLSPELKLREIKAFADHNFVAAGGNAELAAMTASGDILPTGDEIREGRAMAGDATVFPAGPAEQKAALSSASTDPALSHAFGVAGADIPVDDQSLFLRIAKSVFDKLIDKELNRTFSDGDSERKGDAEWEWGYRATLSNPSCEFSDSQSMTVSAKFVASGFARIRLHLHCGPTPWWRTGIKIRPTNGDGRIRAVLGLGSDTKRVFLKMRIKSFGIIAEPENWWNPIDWVLALVVTAIGNSIFPLLVALFARIETVLVELPDTFPGTEMKYDLTNRTFRFVDQDYFAFTGKLAFRAK